MFIQKLTENTLGRDIVIGDIHGEMDAFWALMEKVNFSPLIDRVISVGDLIDRGPDSIEAIKLIDEPWFNPVRGNHEDFVVTAIMHQEAKDILAAHGGEWIMDLDDRELLALSRRFSSLPAAIEVMNNGRKFGVVHAGIPLRHTWDMVTQQLADHEMAFSKRLALSNKLTVTRKRIELGIDDPIKGLDTLFVGHTIHDKATLKGNTVYLDTGAYGAHYKNKRSNEITPRLSCAVIACGVFKIESVKTAQFAEKPNASVKSRKVA